MRVGQYDYVFDTVYDLNAVLEIKYDIGIRLRKAYQSGNKKELLDCVNDLQLTIVALDKFIEGYKLGIIKRKREGRYEKNYMYR